MEGEYVRDIINIYVMIHAQGVMITIAWYALASMYVALLLIYTYTR